ncbi:hypothetical protein AB0E96_32595, partial [Kitasatospora sp. NPDC036755]
MVPGDPDEAAAGAVRDGGGHRPERERAPGEAHPRGAQAPAPATHRVHGVHGVHGAGVGWGAVGGRYATAAHYGLNTVVVTPMALVLLLLGGQSSAA